MSKEHMIKNENPVMISGNHRSEVLEKRKDFDNSLFHRVYKRAYSIVQENVNIQLEKDRGHNVEGNIDNVITFMGRRGTGKSSAMHSFMRALLDNHKEMLSDYTVYNNENNREETVKFIGIDWIDASLLEQGENIFEAILAKMLNELMQSNNEKNHDARSYEMKNLYNEFASIYKKHLNLKQRSVNDSYSMESAIADLRDLSRSSDIRGKFQELVKKYIHIKSYCGDEYRMEKKYETFLVVAIDDIDMNIDSGFEILEKLQRYLKVERLLILIAVNYEQMKLCCEKHFAKVFANNDIYERDKRKEYVGSLADQYLEKVLPAYARVYLPSLKKMDYDRNKITKIKIKTRDGKEDYYPIKKAMFITAWNKTMVRYDVEGLKRHFMEPESLRELNNQGIFREFMLDLDEDSDNFLEMLDFNFRRNMDDLLFRYADEKLPEKEGDIFVALSELDIRRRGQEIVTLFLEAADRQYGESRYDKIARRMQEGYEKFQYSYGELLHGIYCVGRLPVYDKKLVHAILAMYSLTLTKIYYRYKKSLRVERAIEQGNLNVSNDTKERNRIRKERNYVMLKELIGKSVGGSWSRQIIPRYSKYGLGNVNLTYFCGAAKRVYLDRVTFKVDMSLNNKLVDLKKCVKVDLTREKKEECYNKFADVVLEMKWWFMQTLFLVYEEKCVIRDTVNRVIAKNKPQNNKSYPIALNTQNFGYLNLEGRADYNVMNFINNIFLFDEKLQEFVKALCKMIDPILDNFDYNKIVEKLKHKDGFYKDMYDWTIKYGGMVVPAYSMDIYYNMFKRLVRTQQLSNEQYVDTIELFGVFYNLIKKIRKHLEINDEYYGEKQYFVECFDECPFIKEIMNFGDSSATRDEISVKVEKIQQYNSFIDKIISHYDNLAGTYEERMIQEMEI